MSIPASEQKPTGCVGCLQSNGTRRFAGTVGVACGGAVIAMAILALLTFSIAPKSVITIVYQIIFGFMIISAEFKFKIMMKWFRFLAPYIGLGFFYFFVAIFTLAEGKWWQILVAAACAAVGLLNCVFGFCGFKRYEAPANEATLERDMAVKYAAKQVTKQADNQVPIAPTGATANPFENDNPFESNRGYTSAYN